MSTLEEFTNRLEIEDFLCSLRDQHDDSLSEESLEDTIDLMVNIIKSYNTIKDNEGSIQAGTYVAGYLGMYIMLYREVTGTTVELIPEEL